MCWEQQRTKEQAWKEVRGWRQPLVWAQQQREQLWVQA